jgi:hypothetical protein
VNRDETQPNKIKFLPLMPLIKLMKTDKPTPLKYSAAESQPKENQLLTADNADSTD